MHAWRELVFCDSGMIHPTTDTDIFPFPPFSLCPSASLASQAFLQSGVSANVISASACYIEIPVSGLLRVLPVQATKDIRNKLQRRRAIRMDRNMSICHGAPIVASASPAQPMPKPNDRASGAPTPPEKRMHVEPSRSLPCAATSTTPSTVIARDKVGQGEEARGNGGVQSPQEGQARTWEREKEQVEKLRAALERCLSCVSFSCSCQVFPFEVVCICACLRACRREYACVSISCAPCGMYRQKDLVKSYNQHSKLTDTYEEHRQALESEARRSKVTKARACATLISPSILRALAHL
jgi:hypothetical protein